MIQWYNTVINKDCCAGALASDCRWIYLEQLKWLWLLLPCCRLLPTQQARQGRSCICPCANAVYSPCAYISWNKWQLMLTLQILNWDVKKWDCDCLCHFSLPAGMCQCADINSTLGSGRLCEQSPWYDLRHFLSWLLPALLQETTAHPLGTAGQKVHPSLFCPVAEQCKPLLSTMWMLNPGRWAGWMLNLAVLAEPVVTLGKRVDFWYGEHLESLQCKSARV